MTESTETTEATEATKSTDAGDIQVRLAVTPEDVHAAGHLFEHEVRADSVRRFLGDASHHLILAWDGDRPVGMVTVIEMVYPDRGSEMFLYDMRVADSHRGRGLSHQMLDHLESLAVDTQSDGVWVVTGTGERNAAARSTFRRRGADEDTDRVRYSWRIAQP